MRLRFTCGVLACFSLGSAVNAAPCVSTSFDLPVPGASQVISHVSDVPSARFPAFWQQGRIGAVAYKIFSNAQGRVTPTYQIQDWAIEITCDPLAGSCEIATTGTPTPDASRIAAVLGDCLIGSTISAADFAPPPEPEPEPEQNVVANNQQDATFEPVNAPPVPCGAELVSEASDVATMQSLLLMAGSDPGPIDGILGPQSFRAMAEYVENPGWGTSPLEVIALVDAALCAE